MDPSTHLKRLLQVQLASDASSVRYLPYCLSTLTKENLQPSSQLTKWTTRIHSLLHSKELGGRWAGLCLAYKSSLLSQSLMIDSAQAWVGAVLPLLTRNESLPTVKAAIRLLRVIFSTAVNIGEFQRQVSLPHIVKFTSTLIPLADNHPDIELKVLCLETLSHLIPLYPTTHRASSAALSAFTLRYLTGSSTGFTNESVLRSASQLYAVIPLTGGKVGAVNLWRKSLEETLAFGWEAYYSLRTTSLIEAQNIARPTAADEVQFSVPLSKDRLHCSITILCDLLRAVVERPVQVPVGNLIKFVTALLSSSTDQEIDGFIDPAVRAMELATVPDLWNAGCELIICLSIRFPHRLDSHSGRLFSVLAHRLEQQHNRDNHLYFIKSVDSLLKNCHPLHSSIIPARLTKCVLPSITKIFATADSVSADQEPSSSKSRNGKKRARNYEGDEVFKTPRQVVCPTVKEETILLTAVDVMQSLFSNPNLSATLQSIIARVITSILVALPRTSPLSLSYDLAFIHVLNTKIQKFGVMIGSGTTSVMSKTLPFVIDSVLRDNDSHIQNDIALLLHPRVPPLVRSMPQIEALSLFKVEEPQEEEEALAALGLENVDSSTVGEVQDVVMGHCISPSAPMTVHTAIETPILAETVTTRHVSLPPKHNPNFSTKDDDIPFVRTSIVDPIGQAATNPSTSLPKSVPMHQVVEDDDDEEMPIINMESDSEFDSN